MDEATDEAGGLEDVSFVLLLVAVLGVGNSRALDGNRR